MIQAIVRKHQKLTGFLLLTVFYCDFVLAAYVPVLRCQTFQPQVAAAGPSNILSDAFAAEISQSENNAAATQEKTEGKSADVVFAEDDFGGGPSQPEMSTFQSVNSNNMVDLFTGDFSYNIPLMDVGGYPVNLSYRSGITMDQEASWVGLGWNINPGTITRNLRGVPDDFNGKADTITKIASVRDNVTTGVTAGVGAEIFGLPLNAGVNGGIFYNNYRGFGVESGANVSLSSAQHANGKFTAGLSVNNNSQEGISVTPSFSYKYSTLDEDENSGSSGSISTSLGYSSRAGLKALQIAAGYRQNSVDENNQRKSFAPNIPSGSISFALPSYLPKITVPYTSRAYSFTGKLGFEITGFDPNASISGYVSMQTQRDADTILTLPAYGYLNYQNAIKNPSALLDFNRERELPYREKPEVPHIGLPSYTYDVFSMTGEGTGGMFRAYRGDIGYVYDHYMKSKDASDAASADVAVGTYAHVGVDLNVNRSYTTTGKWSSENPLANIIGFRSSDTTYEAAYFRNPGEKSINSKTFYDALGGDDVVAAQIVQSSNSSPTISTSAYLNRYSGKRFTGTLPMSSTNVVKMQRDKRTQVISYLNAEEASLVGFSKYIESYKANSSVNSNCNKVIPDLTGTISGLRAEYYNNKELSGNPYIRTDAWINAPDWGNSNNGQLVVPSGISNQNFSVRWNGTLKAPVSGSYIISTVSDDGVSLWLNDSLLIDNWTDHPETRNQKTVNLVAGNYYTLKLEYYQRGDKAKTLLQWSYPGQVEQIIPASYLYYPDTVTKATIGNIDIEERVSRFRQRNHISEIDVVNSDGRRYVYGIPVYNLIQKEVTFAANSASGDASTGLVAYNTPKDISTGNENGQDHYFTQEITPAYAHSFLLTAILSTDYVDLTGDGVSDDDLGDGIKFNYSKIAGADNPYKWRSPAPGQAKNANYNQGLKTDKRDDKGSYVYGEKELWYLHSVESKNMVAVFLLDQTERKDLFPIDETGKKAVSNQAKRLTEIRLYSKPDYLSKGLNATSIKTVHFEYSYDLCEGVNTQKNDSGKLTLKKVWFTYNGNETKKENPYIFHYASTNPVYDAKSYDRWGNYKNAANNPGGMTNADYPYALQPNYSSYATDSTLIANNAAAWNLDSIILPSGGRMKVEYESDDYAFVQHKRALQMFSVAGLGFQNDNVVTQKLYTRQLLSFQDNLIVYATVNRPVQNKKQVLEQYLEGLDTVYFRLSVTMPTDANGSGEEFVPCYASIDRTGNYYGLKDANTIWFKIKGVNKDADGDGDYSPLAKTAIQFLKLNLPSKAYEGSEPGDNLNFVTAIKLMLATAENVREAIGGYETLARDKGYASTIVPLKSIVRLNNPDYRKMGGGLRVKRIKIYDNWTKSTGQKEAVYGQEYFYTTVKEINGVNTTISSGVASYEPMIGGEENPFRVPIQYKIQSAVLAPVTLGYTEEPLGESFFPSASVGYSKVRVRSINTTGKKSANGYEETCFYTTYDFPTITDRSIIDNNSKKRYKPKVANFLRILAKHYLTIAQGFKVELNDMNGKVRSQATYPETDSINPITYTENFYRVDNNQSDVKHLSNTVWTIDPSGNIDTASTIGKDVEVMMDMREQYSQNIGANVSPNVDILPVGGIPGSWWSMIGLPQYEETKFRSVATTKIIQRYGILDSVIHEEKGSRISTKNMLYDSETGDVLLTRTQNEFNDPVYNFSYPSHWAYDGMGEAYKNINAVFNGLKIKAGKIIGGMASGRDTVFFSSGDEILVSSKEKTGAEDCTDNNIATFKSSNKVWAIDSAVTGGGRKSIYFIDEGGKTFAGNDVSMKIIRSGRRNINTSVGSTTTLKNPLQKSGNTYVLKFVDTTNVINTAATEFKQLWHVAEKRKLSQTGVCVEYADCSGDTSCTCQCLSKIFNYLLAYNKLFTPKSAGLKVSTLVQNASSAGYNVNINDCNILAANADSLFYATTFNTTGTQYKARFGNCVVSINSTTGSPVNFTYLKSNACNSTATVPFRQLNHVQYPYPASEDTATLLVVANRQMIVYDSLNAALNERIEYSRDTSLDKIMSEKYFPGIPGIDMRYAFTIVNFDNLSTIPPSATVFYAELRLNADTRGHVSGYSDPFTYSFANPYQINRFTKSNWVLNTPRDTIDNNLYYPAKFDPKYGSKLYYTPDITSFFYNSSHVRQSLQSIVIDEPIIQARSGSSFYLYSTFFSHKYATDTSKRPKVFVKYFPYDTTTVAILSIDSCSSCSSSNLCISAITDTLLNPYRVGLLGNFRPYRSHVFYTDRDQVDPAVATDIRNQGEFVNYAPFWSFNNGKLVRTTDTTYWVWNSEQTLFNQKGFELENKDPLGRYNAGLYGYNLTLPIGVAQNSKYREVAFEGFEDYKYVSGVCDTTCAVSYRQMDYSTWLPFLDTTQRHTGKYSLRIGVNNDNIGLTYNLTSPGTTTKTPLVQYKTDSVACAGRSLHEVRTDSSALITGFSPSAGDSVIVGGWVKELQDCLCSTYVNNKVVIYYIKANGSATTDTVKTLGNIVEGWQRFEKAVVIPADAVKITFSLQTDKTYTTYFDDLRIHPYKANMQSFVYDPVSLRLMAELDENNYATFYEYDDDGTLIRVKKETERGIKTIKETRSVLSKRPN